MLTREVAETSRIARVLASDYLVDVLRQCGHSNAVIGERPEGAAHLCFRITRLYRSRIPYGLLQPSAVERLGAKPDGILRSHQLHAEGSLRDTVVFSIIASERPVVKQHLTFKLG
jgi:hypothetical protein